jgi:membrane-bound lytic murein transglycosylase B
LSAVSALPAFAQSPSDYSSSASGGRSSDSEFAAAIRNAAIRFGLPETWIRAVIGVESAWNRHAISRAGAMGLMQVMPATYAELRRRYGLGPDPFNPRDNIMAGAAYLREMYDRYGEHGFLAAYNAGPGRWEQFVHRGRQLPAETRVYIARLMPQLGLAITQTVSVVTPTSRQPAPPQTPFVAVSSGASNSAGDANSLPVRQPTNVTARAPTSEVQERPAAIEPRPAHPLFAVWRPQ